MNRTGAVGGPRLTVDEKECVVFAVLAGEMTTAEAARRHGTSAQAIGQRRDRFVEAGKASLESRMPGGPGRGGTRPSADCGPKPSS
jgi:transposase